MVDDELASLTIPTAILWGDKDSFLKAEQVRDVLERATVVRVATIADAGHLLTYERPQEVAAGVAEHLAG